MNDNDYSGVKEGGRWIETVGRTVSVTALIIMGLVVVFFVMFVVYGLNGPG